MPDVLRATYSDLKTVKTRSVCQLILELPIEALTDVVGLLGAPVPGNEVWVAVARLRGGGAAIEQVSQAEPPETPHKPTRLSTLAGIICNEGAFWRYLTENGHEATDAEEAAEQLRLICGAIGSRRELDHNTHAGAKFRDLKANYALWLKDVAA